MKYILIAGEDEESGSIVCDSTSGHPYLFHDHAVACEIARKAVENAASLGLDPAHGVFVAKVVATAFYLPIKRKTGEVDADETIVHPQESKEEPNGNAN